MSRPRLIMAILFAVAVSSCGDATVAPSTAPFPTRLEVIRHVLGEDDARPAGLMQGRLLPRGRCLWIIPGAGAPYIAMWPPGYTLVETAESIVVLDAAGLLAGRTGDPYSFGGGEAGSRAHAATLADLPLPDACPGESFWIVTEILPPRPS